MSTLCKLPFPSAPRGADGLAIIGRTLHDLRGIRFDDGEDGNKPADPKPEEKPKAPTDPKPDDEKKFSQSDVDRIVADRLARERKPKPEEKPKPDAPRGDETKTLTDADVQKQIDDALAAKDLELAIERANDVLDKALDGRQFSASQVRNLDLKPFVKDGKSVDKAAIEKWVGDNTTEGAAQKRRDPGAGHKPDGDKSGVAAGADAYAQRHPSKSKQ